MILVWSLSTEVAGLHASSAPRLAVRQICTTVDRSTFHFSAASRWVACPVSTETNSSYFSLGASRRRDLREFMIRSDKMISLQTALTRRLVAGYFCRELAHEVRRKTDAAAAAGFLQQGAQLGNGQFCGVGRGGRGGQDGAGLGAHAQACPCRARARQGQPPLDMITTTEVSTV